MRVKHGDQWLECARGAPLMIELTEADKRNIANMAADATRYAIFDDADVTTADEKRAWMEAGATPRPEPVAPEFYCPRGPGEDSPFLPPFNGAASWRDGTCSYCGSLSPDGFFAAVEAGAEVVPTDKNYKAYIRGGELPGQVKFYFQHLDEAGMHRFIELLNGKRMALAAPGHFYVRPFFCVPVEPAA